MPYLFTCPHCETRTQVDDQFSGQSGQCVSCGNPIQLPDFAQSTIVSAPQGTTSASPMRWIAGSIVSVIILGCLLFALIRFGGESVGRMTAGRDQAMSMKNLELIAQALNAYAADHGNYPPVASVDQSGKPLFSWRVLILPYLNEMELYNQLNLSVGWDDPANAAVLRRMPTVYQHPASANYGVYNQSGYYLITGPGTLFPSSGPLGPSDIVDDPTQTILVIEAKPDLLSASWAEPSDVSFATFQSTMAIGGNSEIGGWLDDGVAMATTDGRGHFLPNTTDPLVLQSLVTPRGGERLPDDTLN